MRRQFLFGGAAVILAAFFGIGRRGRRRRGLYSGGGRGESMHPNHAAARRARKEEHYRAAIPAYDQESGEYVLQEGQQSADEHRELIREYYRTRERIDHADGGGYDAFEQDQEVDVSTYTSDYALDEEQPSALLDDTDYD